MPVLFAAICTCLRKQYVERRVCRIYAYSVLQLNVQIGWAMLVANIMPLDLEIHFATSISCLNTFETLILSTEPLRKFGRASQLPPLAAATWVPTVTNMTKCIWIRLVMLIQGFQSFIPLKLTSTLSSSKFLMGTLSCHWMCVNTVEMGGFFPILSLQKLSQSISK